MRHLIPCLLICLAIPLAAQAGPAPPPKKKTLQCWTDDKGMRMCGDTVPPQYVKKEREVIDQSGRVVETKAREKTAAEIAAEKAARDKAVADKAAAAEQAKYDKFLLDTYPRLRDLEKTKEERITIIDGQLKLAGEAIADGETQLKKLKDRQVKAPDDKKLAKQVKDYEAGVDKNRRAVESLKEKRAKVEADLGSDIERYKKIAPPAALAPPPEKKPG